MTLASVEMYFLAEVFYSRKQWIIYITNDIIPLQLNPITTSANALLCFNKYAQYFYT